MKNIKQKPTGPPHGTGIGRGGLENIHMWSCLTAPPDTKHRGTSGHASRTCREGGPFSTLFRRQLPQTAGLQLPAFTGHHTSVQVEQHWKDWGQEETLRPAVAHTAQGNYFKGQQDTSFLLFLPSSSASAFTSHPWKVRLLKPRKLRTARILTCFLCPEPIGITSMAFQKKFLNPWTLVIGQRTAALEEELEMEMLPVLMRIELSCSKISGLMKVKNKKKRKPYQKQLWFL